jgi:hypothetical protein
MTTPLAELLTLAGKPGWLDLIRHRAIAAREAGSLLQPALFFNPVFFGEESPITWRERNPWVLSGFFEHGQRAGCSHELAQSKPGVSYCLIEKISFFEFDLSENAAYPT